MKETVINILTRYNNDHTRLMDILIDIQDELGYIPDKAIGFLISELPLSRVDVEQTLSFYHFFSNKPIGKYRVYLNDSAVSNMMGRQKVKEAFEKEAGCKFGEVTADGLIGLFDTACIGMNDQEPAAIINDVVFTNLTPFRVREIIRDIRSGMNIHNMFVQGWGDGNNSSTLVRAVVTNNIRKIGKVIFSDYNVGDALRKVVKMNPMEVIDLVKTSNIRGRGGAGFPTGMKWEFCRKNESDTRYVFCNADEGEPGTFKDRVVLTQYPKLIFEGMVIAGDAIDSKEGILYLRYEYRYLRKFLETQLEEMRQENLLGKNILGVEGFDFDIRIQFGAGAYVCGEESALIESAEGKRGEPRDRPPFPVEKGYLEKPTVVNNVETLCSVVKAVYHGADWYRSMGTRESTGTKLLSISGDIKYPGVYEVEWGFTVNDLLDMCGIIEEPQAVQIGGPSGSLIGPDEFGRVLCYSDLSTGGSLIVIGKNRDILKDIVLNFTNFFIDESCGSCGPCRSMTVILRDKLLKILNGFGVESDIDEIVNWSKVMKANRCGLGQSAANPLLSSIKTFRHLYEARVNKDKDFDTGFDLTAATRSAAIYTGRIQAMEVN